MSNYNVLSQATPSKATMFSDGFSQVIDSHGQYVYKQQNYYAIGDKRFISSVQPQTAVPATLSNAIIV
jgi:hypothetical protein